MSSDRIPIIVVCFNNGRYVRNMVDQLCRIDPGLVSFIRILDNCSTEPETLAYLESTPVHVIRNQTNEGPWISPSNNADLYHSLPDLFILTDPDLELNPALPPTFIRTMADIAIETNSSKVGLALDISTPELFLEGPYVEQLTIAQHESQFWTSPIPDTNPPLYRAPVDTTFCVINKRVFDHGSRHIRIAGDFTAKHLPWYKLNPLYSLADIETLLNNSLTTRISTTFRLLRYNFERGLLSHDEQVSTNVA